MIEMTLSWATIVAVVDCWYLSVVVVPAGVVADCTTLQVAAMLSPDWYVVPKSRLDAVLLVSPPLVEAVFVVVDTVAEDRVWTQVHDFVKVILEFDGDWLTMYFTFKLYWNAKKWLFGVIWQKDEKTHETENDDFLFHEKTSSWHLTENPEKLVKLKLTILIARKILLLSFEKKIRKNSWNWKWLFWVHEKIWRC